MNAWLAKPIPLSLVYCEPARLFATPALMPLKSPLHFRMLDLRGFSAVAASDRSRRLAAMAIPSANAISQRTIDRF
jgi:hypothetical protein